MLSTQEVGGTVTPCPVARVFSVLVRTIERLVTLTFVTLFCCSLCAVGRLTRMEVVTQVTLLS